MKGATSDNIIIPQAEGYLQVPTIKEGKCMDVGCYYSPEFISTVLSDNDVLCSSKFSKEYNGKLMLKFFEPEEKWPEDQQEQIKNQKLDDVTKQYDHNYGNCILSCTQKKVQSKCLYSRNILCWIMLYYANHYTF